MENLSTDKQPPKQTAREQTPNAEICRTRIFAFWNWRAGEPLRKVCQLADRLPRIQKKLISAIRSQGGLAIVVKRGFYKIKIAGLREFGRAIIRALNRDRSDGARNDYQEWIRRYDTLNDGQQSELLRLAASLPKAPLVSILMPVFDPEPELLVAAVESVIGQVYSNWELCIVGDSSTDERIRSILEDYAARDTRLKVTFRGTRGYVSAAFNRALDLAGGEFIALLDQDDRLSVHALYYLAEAILRRPEAMLIYSDEDQIDENCQRRDPYFKPDWNLYLFRSQNFIHHLGVYRTELVKRLGGFRVEFEGSQDYDLALRCIEAVEPGQIAHIPRVLYHRRRHNAGLAGDINVKPDPQPAAVKAIDEHLHRCGVRGYAEITESGMFRVHYDLPEPAPLVSLIILTRNKPRILRKCIDSILAKTTYPHYEIIIIDNGSDDPAAQLYLRQLDDNPLIRVVQDNRSFNFSALNNRAVTLVKGELLALLNNDVEVISPGWLVEMAALALQPNVGAVGARLWYPNNTLQHGGVITGLGGIAGHAHKYLRRGDHGYFHRAALTQNLSAVTAACLVIRKSIYEQVGGMDENLRVAYNDVDFCLRLRIAGYDNVWTPYAELFHHESASRGYEDSPEKLARFNEENKLILQTWGARLANDPAYNPNLTLDYEDFSLAWPPRVNLLNT
ncbi:MAG: glycosyltransferase family 2 protein [Deltaproteobacteria bacterium]|nr:glycosyltransferase family 2 protein [Deltaproteobacteria bacterium]